MPKTGEFAAMSLGGRTLMVRKLPLPTPAPGDGDGGAMLLLTAPSSNARYDVYDVTMPYLVPRSTISSRNSFCSPFERTCSINQPTRRVAQRRGRYSFASVRNGKLRFV